MLLRRRLGVTAMTRLTALRCVVASPSNIGSSLQQPSLLPQQQLSCFVSRRQCSTEASSSEEEPAAVEEETPKTPQELLVEELDMLTDQPLPIGTLFKTLSPESRKTLGKMQMPLEAFLMKNKDKFTVYKEEGAILVARTGSAPFSAMQGEEVAGDNLFATAGARAKSMAASDTQKVYKVLQYIPNEWSSYVLLPIPTDVKKDIIRKPAKHFFDKHKRYFEVRFDPNHAHTFDVRRSQQLQQYMATQDKRGGKPGSGGP